MFRKIIILLSVLVMIFAVSWEPAVNEPISDDKPDVTDTPQTDDNTDKDDPDNPHNAQDIKLFMNEKDSAAKEAFFWFEVSPLPAEEGAVDINSIKEIDGIYYYKVGHESIKSLSDMENYLNTLFSEEITNKLLDEHKDTYIDIDGELWVADASRGTDISVGNSIFTLTSAEKDKIVYTANVEEIDLETEEVVAIKTYNYVYEKTADGWRWTQFGIYE